MTASCEHVSFLRAILDQPEEDAPRLVYADWLDEQGDGDRATFIRLQCRIAALQQRCLCGGCVRLRGGGQHTNGPCAVDRERDELADGSSRQAFLRRREGELCSNWWKKGWCPEPFRGRTWSPPEGPTIRFEGGEVTFCRGFVAEVTLTCADWIGGPCRRCGGEGHSARPAIYRERHPLLGPIPCGLCSGTGRTQGVGPALVRATPLERVTLSDKRPEVHTPPGGPPNYSWYAAGFDDDAATLPDELFDRLPGGVSSFSAQRRAYPSEAAALDDLDRAARAWARSVEPATKEG